MYLVIGKMSGFNLQLASSVLITDSIYIFLISLCRKNIALMSGTQAVNISYKSGGKVLE